MWIPRTRRRPAKARRPTRARRRGPLTRRRRAQAMTEYSLITFGIGGFGIVALYELLPGFILSFQRYFDSFYTMLNLPIP